MAVDSSPRADNRVGGDQERHDATNKPAGDHARRGASKKRSQLKTSLAGGRLLAKRSKVSGRFVDQKEAPAKKKFKGVHIEK